MKKTLYGAIDGLKAIAAIGVVMIHMLSNNNYMLGSRQMVENVTLLFINLIFLFMVLSAFGMCCGYYEKVMNSEIVISKFYSKRYKKILPFFSLLVIIDFIMAPSKATLIEAFADLTLAFGFLPECGNIKVIGVGWYLGVLFVFYMIFPFFCYLISTRRKAWSVLVICIIYNYVGRVYFGITSNNILFCSCYFVLGGILFLYRDKLQEISNKYSKLIVGGILIFSYLYFICYYKLEGQTTEVLLVICALSVTYVLGENRKILNNKVTQFISGISLEIYLAHMMIFRCVEKTGLNYLLGDGWLQYVFTVVLVLILTVIFACTFKFAYRRIPQYILHMKDRLGKQT